MFLKIVKKAYSLYKAKQKDYGNSWYSLGGKGVFVYVYNKVERLKNLYWGDKEPNFESVEDNMLDLIVYSILLYWGYLRDKGVCKK
ncbi:MAG: nucleotide modification associated domain-containing protein [Nanopusillaceae archaeon]